MMRVQQSPYLVGSIPGSCFPECLYKAPRKLYPRAPPRIAIQSLPLFLQRLWGRVGAAPLSSSSQPAAFLGLKEDLGRQALGPGAEDTQRGWPWPVGSWVEGYQEGKQEGP